MEVGFATHAKLLAVIDYATRACAQILWAGGLHVETRDAYARRRRDEDWTLTAPILNPI
jgi:hypothetical protein